MFYIFAFDFIFRNEIQSAIDALQIKDGLGVYSLDRLLENGSLSVLLFIIILAKCKRLILAQEWLNFSNDYYSVMP